MVPSHYLNQCWNIVNWNLRNKLQWNIQRNSYIFIQENAFENVVCEMAVILSRPQCVNPSSASHMQIQNPTWPSLSLLMAWAVCGNILSRGSKDQKEGWSNMVERGPSYLWHCHQTSNKRCTLAGNKMVVDSDVVGALPVDAAPTTSFLT